MPNFPTNNPYNESPILADAYARGWNHGHGFACHNVPVMGDTVWCETLGRVTIDAENIKEVHEALCYEAESNSRQFSPFEFTAYEFNQYGEGNEDMPSSDEAWEAFDQGINDSISADLAAYDDSDYGIEGESV